MQITFRMGLLQKPAYVIPGLTRDPLISLKYGIAAGQARNDEKVFCNSPILQQPQVYISLSTFFKYSRLGLTPCIEPAVSHASYSRDT